MENETVRIPLALSEQYLAGSRIVALDYDSGQAFPEIVDVRLFVTGNYCCFEVIFADCHGPPGGNQCYESGLEFGFLEADEKVFQTVNVLPGVYDNSVQPVICEQQDLAAEITSAELIVEIPAPTPVEELSWGTIKAIYR